MNEQARVEDAVVIREIPDYVRKAIKTGPLPVLRNWRDIPLNKCTRAERVMRFAEHYLKVPEGSKVGQPLHIEPFQEAFIYAVFDNPAQTRIAVLSIARKNGKTALCAIILLAYILGPEAIENSMISSAAMSRDQAGIVFRLMSKLILQNEVLKKRCKITPSAKTLVGLAKHVEFKALAKESSTVVGRSDRVILGDEWGQIAGVTDDFVENLMTGQGAFDDALAIIISTQAPNDQAYLSTLIDGAVMVDSKETVVHLYASEPDCDMEDEKAWADANPALDIFRSRRDIRLQVEKAKMLPATEAKTRNLVLNQRVARDNLYITPNIWKMNTDPPDLDVFRKGYVSLGLDLSRLHDLTAAVLASKDEDGFIHVLPFVFVPSHNIEEKAQKDKVPYPVWIKNGELFSVGGKAVDYEVVAAFMRDKLEELGIKIDVIEFDRWRINRFKDACEKERAFGGVEWHEVGQGYKDMSPRCESLLNHLLEGNIRHGAHPLLNMAVSSAIAVNDPAGNMKLDKEKSNARIDPLVALVMAVGGLETAEQDPFDPLAFIG